MAIKVKGFEAAEATTPNLDAVTTEGNTTTNSITVGGVSIGTAYSLPTSDGAANQVLQTDGSGGVTFQTLDVTGGLEYKGAFNATAGTPSLANAEKGDFYVVDTAGTIYGQTWGVGDHLLINEDMGGTITNSKIDKIDNTDQVTSVNGQTGAVTLTASDVSALASGDNVSELTNDAGYLTSAPVTSVNSLTGAVTLSGNDIAADHTATNYTAANANVDGHLSGIDTALGTALAPTLDSVTDNGATTTNDISVGGIISAGNIVSDADGTRTLGTEANRYITLFGDVNGAVRFKAKNDSGSAMTKGQVVYIKGVSGDVPTVDLADADVSSKMPAFGLVYANANDQAEVQIVSFGNLTGLNTSAFSAGDTLFVSTTAGTLTATKPTGESAALQNIGRVVRSHASDGVVIVGGAGRSAATPNLDQNKLFLGNASNQAVSTALSSIALSSLNDDLSYLEPANNLSDIANASTARTNLGLAIGSDVQAYDAQLADVAGLTPADGNIIIGNGTNFITESGATARTSLGLGTAAVEDVGTTANDIVQLDGSARLPAVDGSQLTNLPSGVTTLGGLSDVTLGTLASGEVLKYNGSNWVDSALTASDVSALAIANNLSDVANASTARTNLGLAIGSDVQAYDAQLADVAGLTPTDGNIIIGNGTNFITESGATARTSLGLGTAAVEDVGTTANDIVQLDGSARLPAVDGSQLTNLPSATVALDGIDPGTGDATLATDGSITIDAQASDSDIIFKGTDGGVDTTFVTIDGSDAGTIIGNHDLELSTNGSEIRMGDDVTLRHVNNDGLEILIDSTEETNFDPSLRITATQAHTWGPRLFLRHTGSTNVNDAMGSVVFEGRNNSNIQKDFARIDGVKIDGTNNAEDGTLRLIARSNGSLLNNNGLLIQGDGGNVFVTVPGHDGSANGLKLGSTLVTATAAELNTLDGITATTAELNLLDGVTASTSELNTLDGITASTTELNFLDTSAQSPSTNDVLTYNGTTLAWSAQAGGSVALDGIDPGTGDATLATDGNITIDAQASNSDIIFKGTDGGVDTTFVTIDGSDAGTIKANGDLRLEHDGAKIYFGADSDVYLDHQHNGGLRLDMGSPDGGEPKFTIQSSNSTSNGPSIILDHNPASGTSGQIVSELVTNGIDSGGGTHTYTRMRSVSSVATAGSEAGAYKFYVATGGANAGTTGTETFRIEGDSGGNRTVNVVQHDGSSSGLELAGTLVTATAAELNTLDGITATTAELNLLDGVTATTAELNTLDGITATTTELNFLDTSAQSPSANDVLTYNGTTLAWSAQSGGISNVVDDTSPQLGGNLDLNGNDLITTSNANLDLAPNGTGVVVIRGNNNSGAIKLNCEQNSHGVTIQGPAHSANATYTLTLPVNDGDADQVLKTDGSGVLSWVDQAGGGGGGGLTYSAITANTTAQADYHYSCTGSITLTLPTSGISAGSEIRVKNMGTGTITIDPQTGTIDGSTTDRTLTEQYSALILISTGTNWEII